MSNLNNAQEIIKFIKEAKKATPVKAYIKGDLDGIDFSECKVFGNGNSRVVIGDWKAVSNILEENKGKIEVV